MIKQSLNINHAISLYRGILASIVCRIIGVMIVKKLVMMSGGIAHTAYGGVGLGYLLNFPPILGAFFFAIAAAFGIGFIKRKGGTRADVIISMFWSLGMALGILFIALRPGYPPDLSLSVWKYPFRDQSRLMADAYLRFLVLRS
jgi:zinc transport system permease protein